MTDELIEFLKWYWREIEVKPYDISASEIVSQYEEETK